MAEISLLLVDDELPLLGLLKKYLEREGFSVEAAENGASALAAAELRAFDLVVLDMHLPDMSGQEVMAELLARYPECRILISSGIPFGSDSLPEADRGRVSFLLKPYMPRQLLEAIREALGSAKRASA